MAITLADFTKIWSSTSPLTPYSFSESNYKEGWNFVGATPPARQMWDSIQKQNDEKMEYIVDNFLPLSGGTMTGAIKRDGTAITDSVDTSVVRICGGTGIDNGGVLALFGKSNSSYPGFFSIKADDTIDESFLIGTPSGSLTWLNKQVERVNASGTKYIRYESGLQICWGISASATTNAGTSTTTTITFPVAFKDTNYTVTFVDRFGSGSWGNHTFSTSSYTTTSVGLYLQNNAVGPYTYSLSWMAVGFWK